MFFKKRPAAPEGPALDGSLPDLEIPESERVVHGSHTIIPRTKQLHNGNWIVEIILEEEHSDGRRRYDFAGPMAEYPSQDEARRAGVDHAIERLGER
jgi:hypothetical protein